MRGRTVSALLLLCPQPQVSHARNLCGLVILGPKFYTFRTKSCCTFAIIFGHKSLEGKCTRRTTLLSATAVYAKGRNKSAEVYAACVVWPPSEGAKHLQLSRFYKPMLSLSLPACIVHVRG